MFRKILNLNIFSIQKKEY